MIVTDLFSMILRLAELAFAAIVAGINGEYLHAVRDSDSWAQGRFIYTEVVAAIAIFLSIVWLFPFAGSFVHWPVDVVISICWFVAFGLLVNALDGPCGYVFDWGGISFRPEDQCGKWKAVEAFTFLSAVCWIVSAALDIFWVRDREARVYRRRWYNSRV
ncbi:marvel domain-containing protein [Hypoxylon rubiginosum]|uniref:Marvel domain-containing protein n=1 Tax=Hypoxylon rubiginosum TaxID=110542 RepID=A0ACB9YQU3_9PEZI|nr:marvel domain-containing protein [Hypoxylon rubiginosum]